MLLMLVIGILALSVPCFGASETCDCPEIQQMEEAVQDLQQQLEDIKANQNQIKRDMLHLHGMCDVEAEGNCFYAIFPNAGHDVGTNDEAARLLCEQDNAKPANIYSESHYTDLMNYLLPYLGMQSPDQSLNVRTGMTFLPETQLAYLTDGSIATFTSWAKGYPTTFDACSDCTSLLIKLYPGSDTFTGMYNTQPDQLLHGVLCEVEVERHDA